MANLGSCQTEPHRHLYPLSIYTCPNGHEPFYSYAYNGAVCWCCPTCGAAGTYAGCDGEGFGWLRPARPVASLAQRAADSSEEPAVRLIRHRALSPEVLAVARTRIEGAWAAYIDAVPGHDHHAERDEVLRHGAKLIEPIARVLFPEFSGLPYAP